MKFAKDLFGLFLRLHPQREFEGTGPSAGRAPEETGQSSSASICSYLTPCPARATPYGALIHLESEPTTADLDRVVGESA